MKDLNAYNPFLDVLQNTERKIPDLIKSRRTKSRKTVTLQIRGKIFSNITFYKFPSLFNDKKSEKLRYY
jgi:hypothetical protein